MKTIYLVRHGETESNAGGMIRGGALTSLTERGLIQADLVGARCSQLEIDLIVSSTHMRTRQTTQQILKHVSRPVEYSELFIEWNRGASRIGKQVSDPSIKESDNANLQNLLTHDARIEDAENFNDLNARAAAALQFIFDRPEENILVVGHGLFSRIFMGKAVMGEHFSGRECFNFIESFRTENTGISILQYKAGFGGLSWCVQAWNDHAHLG